MRSPPLAFCFKHWARDHVRGDDRDHLDAHVCAHVDGLVHYATALCLPDRYTDSDGHASMYLWRSGYDDSQLSTCP